MYQHIGLGQSVNWFYLVLEGVLNYNESAFTGENDGTQTN
jgi:hypothetical protein